MTQEKGRMGPHEKAYLNGRSDAAWDIERGILDRDLFVRGRYIENGKSGAFARRWRQGYDEVRRELLAPEGVQSP